MERIKLAIEMARNSRLSTSMVPVPNNFSGCLEDYQATKKIKIDLETYRNNRIIAGLNHKGARSAYKMLRTQVLRKMSENNWNSLAITSPGIGEGKTLTAINLAISLAREVNHTVLLVEMDLGRLSIARYFDFQPQSGIEDYLMGKIALSSIMVNPEIERFVLLPGRLPVEDSSDLMMSPQMVNLVTELKNRYRERIILFDMPPLLYADDALAFAPHVDATLIVIEEGKTQQDDLLRAVNLLKSHHIIGTVLNKTPYIKENYY